MHEYGPHRFRKASSLLRHRPLYVGVVLLAFPASMPHAAEIYKSIDANGNVVYSDHADPSMPQTSIVHLEDHRYPPREMHVCWTNCFTLMLDNGVYRRTDGTDETWTVETFTSQSVVLHRHSAPADWNGRSTDVTYAGKVVNDRLVGVTLNGQAMSGIDASWGIALNTLPGSNAERDAHVPVDSNVVPAGGNSAPAIPFVDPDAAAAVSTATAPPPLPDDPQPAAAPDGYTWTPGYWSWGVPGYRWVPGIWLRPPQVGVLWTPAYWGFVGGRYVFHPGHWGPLQRGETARRVANASVPPTIVKTGHGGDFVSQPSAVVNQPVIVPTRATATPPPVERRAAPAILNNEAAAPPKVNRVKPTAASPKP